jgi:hypothetical protein
LYNQAVHKYHLLLPISYPPHTLEFQTCAAPSSGPTIPTLHAIFLCRYLLSLICFHDLLPAICFTRSSLPALNASFFSCTLPSGLVQSLAQSVSGVLRTQLCLRMGLISQGVLLVLALPAFFVQRNSHSAVFIPILFRMASFTVLGGFVCHGVNITVFAWFWMSLPVSDPHPRRHYKRILGVLK